MANPDHLAILKTGIENWNEWRRREWKIVPDLSGADLRKRSLSLPPQTKSMAALANELFPDWLDLSEEHLSGAELGSANLEEANLSGANLIGTDLANTNLIHADLTHSNLALAKVKSANLFETDLTGAKMLRADFSAASLLGADLSGADLTRANLQRARLKNADLTMSTLVETDLRGATLSGCRIYGVSAWGVKLNSRTKQTDLIITPDGESIVSVDDLEVAQFVYLLLTNDKLRRVIDTVTSKVVLILGRFTPERKAVIDAVRNRVRLLGYVPVVFDFDKSDKRDTHETITLLARMSRFIVADITDAKSVPQELVSIVQDLPSVPVVPVLLHGQEPWGMFDHIARYPWVLPVTAYATAGEVVDNIAAIIAPAQARLATSR